MHNCRLFKKAVISMAILFVTGTCLTGCSSSSTSVYASTSNTSTSSTRSTSTSSTSSSISSPSSNSYTVTSADTSTVGEMTVTVKADDAIWITYPDGKEELLVSPKKDEDPYKNIESICDPQISPDKTKVYFLSYAWVTSGAVHVVDLKTKTEKFFCPGNSLKVVQEGADKGKLIVCKHKYKDPDKGGSYDDFYLLDENGKELKDLGETLDQKN